MMEWSNEVVLEFLDLYENEPIIWCAKHEEQKNINAVIDAWKSIEEKISIKCTVQELKKKKESLMSTFRPLQRKVKSTSGTGTATEDVYKPTWFAYEKMAKFLGGECQPRCTQNTEKLENFSATEDNKYSSDINEEITGAENPSTEIVSPSVQPGPSNPEKIFKAPSKGKTKKIIDVVQRRMDEAYTILKTAVKSEKAKSSACSLYGQLVAEKLEALDYVQRVVVMHEINNLLFKATMTQMGQIANPLNPVTSALQQYSVIANQVPHYNLNNPSFSNQQSSLYVSSELPSPTDSYQYQPPPYQTHTTRQSLKRKTVEDPAQTSHNQNSLSRSPSQHSQCSLSSYYQSQSSSDHALHSRPTSQLSSMFSSTESFQSQFSPKPVFAETSLSTTTTSD